MLTNNSCIKGMKECSRHPLTTSVTEAGVKGTVRQSHPTEQFRAWTNTSISWYFSVGFKSFALGRCGSNFKRLIFKLIIWNDICVTRCDLLSSECHIAPNNVIPTLDQVMADGTKPLPDPRYTQICVAICSH